MFRTKVRGAPQMEVADVGLCALHALSTPSTPLGEGVFNNRRPLN